MTSLFKPFFGLGGGRTGRNNTLLSLLSSLFIHSFGGIAEPVKSKSRPTDFIGLNIESCGPSSDYLPVDYSPPLSESGVVGKNRKRAHRIPYLIP